MRPNTTNFCSRNFKRLQVLLRTQNLESTGCLYQIDKVDGTVTWSCHLFQVKSVYFVPCHYKIEILSKILLSKPVIMKDLIPPKTTFRDYDCLSQETIIVKTFAVENYKFCLLQQIDLCPNFGVTIISLINLSSLNSFANCLRNRNIAKSIHQGKMVIIKVK